MMIVGIAGIIWMVTKKVLPFRQILQVEKIKARLEMTKKLASERGVPVAEKLLRQAKIYAMRLERFFASRLEALVARKNKDGEAPGASFWKNFRKSDQASKDKKKET